MELPKIEILLEKYFLGETTLIEEKELKLYFSSKNVASHLEQYKPLFVYLNRAKEEAYTKNTPLKTKKQHNVAWMYVAASLILIAGITSVYNANKESEDLGTFTDPEIAFQETQKALNLISQNVNVGVNSVKYLNEYEQSKNKIFKK